MTEDQYMISDVSKLLDIPTNVLRYLEYQLCLNIKRTEQGHRIYLTEDVELLQGIKKLRDHGFHMRIIKSLIPYINQVVVLEPEKLNNLRDRLEAAVGLSGAEAQDRLKAQYGKVIAINVENGCFVVKDPKTKKTTRVSPALKKTEGVEVQPIARRMDKKKESVDSTQEQNKKKQISDSAVCRNQKDKPSTKAVISKQLESEVKQEIREECKEKESTLKMDLKQEEASKPTEELQDKDTIKKQELSTENPSIVSNSGNKIVQFREIMCSIMMDVLRENNVTLTSDINQTVTQSIVKEMDYMMKMREERQEERFRQLDRTIRETQMMRQQTAATKEGKKKKPSKFFQKHGKVRI